MKVRVDGKLYDLDEASLTNREAILLEEMFGVTFMEFGELLKRGSTKAMSALVWVAVRRENPEAKFEDIEYHFDDFEDDETAEVAPRAEGAPLGSGDESSSGDT